MSRRIALTLVAALAAIAPTILTAQEGPRELPRLVSVLGDPEPGEVRFRLTPAELESVGIPEIPYTKEDRAVADLAEVGVRLLRLGSHVEGELKSALGRTAFSSAVEKDGRVRVEHGLPGGRGNLVLVVDLLNQTAEASYPGDAAITAADRFVFRTLALTLERQFSGDGDGDVDGDGGEADLLLRAARLWGDHPLQPVRLERITAPRDKSWTNLCGVTSASLAHDSTDHGLINERLATGPGASNCRSRCGAGCNAILGTSAWTVDCGEHDRCEQHHSCCVSCQDEFNSASDDYLFASNCRRTGW
jgi:hypothetical protein